MKPQFTTLFLLFLLSLIGAIANAQEGTPQNLPSPDSLAARDARVLAHKLSLSGDQKERLELAANRFHKEMQGLRGPATDVAARRQALQATYQQYRKEIKSILTQVQWRDYEEMETSKKAASLNHIREKKIKVIE